MQNKNFFSFKIIKKKEIKKELVKLSIINQNEPKIIQENKNNLRKSYKGKIF